jgi:hypothetical protein
MGPEDTKDGVDLQLYAPLSAIYGFGCLSPCPGSFTPRKGPRYSFYGTWVWQQELYGRMWKREKPLDPIGFRTPSCPIHRSSLYCLQCAGPTYNKYRFYFKMKVK